MEVRITGVKEVDAALARLEKEEARKIIRQSIRRALKIMLDAARQLAPTGPDQVLRGKPHAGGFLRKMIKVRAFRGRRNEIAARVGVGEKDFKGDAFYGGMVEYGTKRQAAQGFMRRAFEETKARVRDEANRLIREGINATLSWWKRI
jgi:HK97 gp10 family phage protein